jgi:hypothetical protein
MRLSHGTEDLLAHVYGPGAAGGFRFAAVVGAGRDYTDICVELVDCVSQRLVLAGIPALTGRGYQGDAIGFGGIGSVQ